MAKKRYKIVITEYCEEEVTAGKDWGKVNDVPETRYAYTPEITKIVQVEREIFKQNTQELDLTEVIKAINNI